MISCQVKDQPFDSKVQCRTLPTYVYRGGVYGHVCTLPTVTEGVPLKAKYYIDIAPHYTESMFSKNDCVHSQTMNTARTMHHFKQTSHQLQNLVSYLILRIDKPMQNTITLGYN